MVEEMLQKRDEEASAVNALSALLRKSKMPPRGKHMKPMQTQQEPEHKKIKPDSVVDINVNKMGTYFQVDKFKKAMKSQLTGKLEKQAEEQELTE